MRPRLAAVGGFVNAVADGKIGALQAFAAAHIDNFGIRRRDRQCAYGSGGLVIEDRRPYVAVVCGLPDASIYRRHIKNIGRAGEAAHRDRAASTEGTNHAPAHILIERGIELLGGAKNCRQENACQQNKKVPAAAEWTHGSSPLREE